MGVSLHLPERGRHSITSPRGERDGPEDCSSAYTMVRERRPGFPPPLSFPASDEIKLWQRRARRAVPIPDTCLSLFGHPPGVRHASLRPLRHARRLRRARPVARPRPGPAAAGAGLDVADLASPEKWIPAADVARLLELSAQRSGHEDFGLLLAARRRLSTLGPLSVVLGQEPDLRSALRLLTGYQRTYNEALHLALDEASGLATIRLWLEFGEPAPTRQSLELATAALLGIIKELLGPALGAAVGVLLPSGAGGPRHPPARVRAAAAVRPPVHRPGLLRRPARRPERDVRSAAAALRAAVPEVDALTAGRDRDRAGPRARRDAAAARPVLDRAGGPQPGRDPADPAPAPGRGAPELLLDRGRHAGRAGRALPGQRPLLDDRRLQLLGFTAPSTFSRWFRGRFGVTPSQWRDSAAHRPPDEEVAGPAPRQGDPSEQAQLLGG